MKTFLKELAGKMAQQYPKLDTVTFVFPNRRAALYFQHHLTDNLTRPVWSPKLYSIEEFFKKLSDLKEPDKLTLVHKLYKVYSGALKSSESFDRFYFWGEMLLRDFDELDKYTVNATQLFKDLSKLKELDETFDYLTEEQKKFLTDFWIHFDEKPSTTRVEFLRMWRKLPRVYDDFVKSLKKEGLGYEGMIHRDVAEKFAKKPPSIVSDERPLVFAGFNALTRAEEIIITALVQQGAQVHWDIDAYYVNDPIQEAGQFTRQYQQHPVLGDTFNGEIASHLLNHQKEITLTGVPQRIGQAKLVGDLTEKILRQLPEKNLAMDLAKTVVVLPDEGMLLPVLHSLPESLQDINVTMGYPLRNTPLFNLLDLIIEMQVKRRDQYVGHREVTAIIAHPYVTSFADGHSRSLEKEIVEKNRIFLLLKDLQGGSTVFGLIFREVGPEEATAYLLEVIEYFGSHFTDQQRFDREYAFHFYQHCSRLHSILGESSKEMDWRGFQKLFRQVILAQKIPFSGEPLRGLQVMGVLETRNLDFDNVIILSLNEGLLPASSRQGSYIPHAIRKAYGLPTHEHQDAIYAYLFYRVLQRAEHIHFFYNTEPDIVGNGEMSRYLQQLLLESSLKIDKRVLHNPVHVQRVKPIVIPKTQDVLTGMEKYIQPEQGESVSMLSPSSLNDYLECSLRFYLKYVVKLTEASEVEDEPDARMFGIILHDVMAWFYNEIRVTKGGAVTEDDLRNPDAKLDQLINKAFRDIYHLPDSEEVVYEGQRVVVREIAKEFAKKIIERDRAYAPFDLVMIEEPFSHPLQLQDGRKVRIGGTIDRADRKEGKVRVIDYKTGNDEMDFESIQSLFNRDEKRNKAAFQTILYAHVYRSKEKNDEALMPGLLNRRNLFDEKFSFGHGLGKSRGGKAKMDDVRPYLAEFEDLLQSTLEELFSKDIPFQQTSYEKACTYCLYKSICRR